LSDRIESGDLFNVLSHSDSELLEVSDPLYFVLSAKETCLDIDLLGKDIKRVNLALFLVLSPSDRGEVRLDQLLWAPLG